VGVPPAGTLFCSSWMINGTAVGPHWIGMFGSLPPGISQLRCPVVSLGSMGNPGVAVVGKNSSPRLMKPLTVSSAVLSAVRTASHLLTA
jgi:hypothetical protein